MRFSRLGVLAIFFTGIALGIIFAGIGVYSANKIFLHIGVGILAASFVFHIIFYRCPHCKRYLDKNYGAFCPKCGKPLD